MLTHKGEKKDIFQDSDSDEDKAFPKIKILNSTEKLDSITLVKAMG